MWKKLCKNLRKVKVKEMNKDNNIRYTYTITPNAWNLILNVTPGKNYIDEVENKLVVMSEYKDAKEVLSKFTLHGKN